MLFECDRSSDVQMCDDVKTSWSENIVICREKCEIWKLCSIFIVCALTMTGCVTEYNLATQKQERTLYGTEREVKISIWHPKAVADDYFCIQMQY